LPELTKLSDSDLHETYRVASYWADQYDADPSDIALAEAAADEMNIRHGKAGL
jgi:hypothetical protein